MKISDIKQKIRKFIMNVKLDEETEEEEVKCTCGRGLYATGSYVPSWEGSQRYNSYIQLRLLDAQGFQAAEPRDVTTEEEETRVFDGPYPILRAYEDTTGINPPAEGSAVGDGPIASPQMFSGTGDEPQLLSESGSTAPEMFGGNSTAHHEMYSTRSPPVQFNCLSPSRKVSKSAHYKSLSPSQQVTKSAHFRRLSSSYQQTDSAQFSCLSPSAQGPKSAQFRSLSPYHQSPKSAKFNSLSPSHKASKSAKFSTLSPSHQASKSAQFSSLSPSHQTCKSAKFSSLSPSHQAAKSAKFSSLSPSHQTSKSAQFSSLSPSRQAAKSAKFGSLSPSHQTSKPAQFSCLSPSQQASKSAQFSCLSPRQVRASTQFSSLSPCQATAPNQFSSLSPCHQVSASAKTVAVQQSARSPSRVPQVLSVNNTTHLGFHMASPSSQQNNRASPSSVQVKPGAIDAGARLTLVSLKPAGEKRVGGEALFSDSEKMSDDDRMSLTTAVSEDEEGESVHNSPYKAPRAGTTAASFNCTGAVRKAGYLSVKKWLLRKKHQIELARKRGWKGYWVCLKGTTLLFYPCDSREGRSVEAAPKHLIIVDGAIMQPIPEHPKRDYIFCLSTAFGDAYLFQAPCQVELENWVNSIHSACAAAFARHRGKTGTLHLLQEEIFRIDRAIESDSKLKHMAELQLSVVSDAESKQQIMGQIMQWEENLERLHCEQFRLRCYMASLQAGELPNPKGLLTHVSRTTKTTLNRLGVFTVSSFHAYICARSPSLLNNLLAGRGATKRRAPMLSRSNSVSSRRSLQMQQQLDGEKQYKVNLPDNQTVSISLKDSMTVEEFLVAASSRKSLNPMEHFVRVKKRRELEETNYFVPHRTDLIENYLATHEVVEICAKILYQVELSRSSLDHMWGFSVEAELIENSERQDELCCYISRVEDRSTAMQNGIIKGDEIMVINGAIVSDLDMMYIESVLQEELALCLMMRSSRTEPPDLASLMKTTDEIIESLVCPPPPTETSLNEEMISRMIVPAPSWNKALAAGKEPASPDGFPPPASDTSDRSNVSSLEIESFLKNSDISGCCRSPVERRGGGSPTGSITSTQSQSQLTPSRQLSDGERLKKVILELVDTERSYVKHLNNLLENYLEPLKNASFLSSAEVNALFGNIREIVAFQRLFLQALQEALDMEQGFPKFDQPYEFKNVLFSIGSAFLYYASQFKLYSSFCASHSKAQKVLHPSEGNQALQEFLASRNPRQQHSATLESYLIKPIQRILKYPLLLQELKALTTPGSDEHRHLVEALKVMEKVAEHINEMQRIHEEYGAIFDHLFRQHQKSCKQDPRISRDPHLPQPIDLSPGDLLYYGGVEWLNISDFLGKIKKGLELHAMCFVFKTAVVFLCKERLRQKKKLMVSSVGAPGKNSSSEVEIIRYQVLIPVTEVQVRASSMKDMESHFLWELIHLKSQLQRRSEKVYHLSNSTSEFRNAFLKTIRQIIRESVRNMSIPANKPSSSSSSSGKGNTNTLQPSRSAAKKKPPIAQSATLQRHSAGNIDYDNLESYDNVPETQLGHDQSNMRTRSKTVSDAMDELSDSTTKSDGGKDEAGTRSEGEEEVIEKKKATLGRTPNHLSLSTTSTLSTGSTGSMAKLIQASNQPAQYQPVKSVGSPVWKPRDAFIPAGGGSMGAGSAGQRGESFTLPRAGKSSGREDHFLVYEEYGGNIYTSSKKDTENIGKDNVGTVCVGLMISTSTTSSPSSYISNGGSPRYNGITSTTTTTTTYYHQNQQPPTPRLSHSPSTTTTIHNGNQNGKQTTRPTHNIHRPNSLSYGPTHLPPAGVSCCSGGGGSRRGARGGMVKSSPWPGGFPYTERHDSQVMQEIEGVLGGGAMTIDSLLQQLRALS